MLVKIDEYLGFFVHRRSYLLGSPVNINTIYMMNDCPYDIIVEGNMVEQQYPDVQAEECKVPKPDKVLKYGTAGKPQGY